MASMASPDVYRRVSIETASQGQLVLMLFDGAIRKAERAKESILAQDLQAAHNHLVRAQDIIAELRNALDMSVGEIAKNLDRVYEYFDHLLVQANVNKDTAPIKECVEHMAAMRHTWAEAFEAAEREQSSETDSDGEGSGGASVMNLKG